MEYRAAPGFNVFVTANLRDHGVHHMSSALKRRFNFETVHLIAVAGSERRLIASQLAGRMVRHDVIGEMPEDALDLVVAVFWDLRRGAAEEGATAPVPGSVMSTAEPVNTTHAATLAAGCLNGGPVTGAPLVRQAQLGRLPRGGERRRCRTLSRWTGRFFSRRKGSGSRRCVTIRRPASGRAGDDPRHPPQLCADQRPAALTPLFDEICDSRTPSLVAAVMLRGGRAAMHRFARAAGNLWRC